jgi:hypothetical protein
MRVHKYYLKRAKDEKARRSTLMVQTAGLYLCILVAIGFFCYNCRNLSFLRVTLIYFVLVTVALCLIEYGSAYSLNWDFARWHGGDTWQLFPLSVSGGGPNKNMIPKTSSTYWFLTVLVTSFYITFPQAVVRGIGSHVIKSTIFASILLILFDLFGIGLGFVSVVLTFTSLFSPFPNENWLVMLAGCVFIIIIMGPTIVRDVRHGFHQFVPH